MELSARVTFAGGGLERAATIRGDAAALAARWAAPGTRVLALWRGKPLVTGAGGERIGWLPPGHLVLGDAVEAPIFIGEDAEGAIFAADVSSWEPAGLDAAALGSFFDPTEQAHPALPPEVRFAELRQIMARLEPVGAEVAVTARALLNWHASHRFCARCGEESAIVMAGWQRTCPACGAHHFPRTDPVVIMLVRHRNSVLLGRSPGWPEGMYSCLAGFVEPGETVEAAVRREVAEETTVRVGRVGYVASQPWPFPNSLMVGCVGEAETTEIVPDPAEIEDALWLSREDLVSAWAGTHPRIRAARKGAIAHFMLENWLAGRIA